MMLYCAILLTIQDTFFSGVVNDLCVATIGSSSTLMNILLLVCEKVLHAECKLRIHGTCQLQSMTE